MNLLSLWWVTDYRPNALLLLSSYKNHKPLFFMTLINLDVGWVEER